MTEFAITLSKKLCQTLNFCIKMTGGMSSRMCYTKLNFDVSYASSLSLRRDTNDVTHVLHHTFSFVEKQAASNFFSQNFL